jgi:hypothetical protein
MRLGNAVVRWGRGCRLVSVVWVGALVRPSSVANLVGSVRVHAVLSMSVSPRCARGPGYGAKQCTFDAMRKRVRCGTIACGYASEHRACSWRAGRLGHAQWVR